MSNEVATLQPVGPLSRFITAVEEGLPPALALMLDDKLFSRVQAIAETMSKANGFVPKHCIGQPEVCFAVATRAIIWKLDPFAVAQCTYQPVPGAKVSYEGKLVQAILEQSGRIDGAIQREYYGDWNKIRGRFVMKEGSKSDENGEKKKYAARNWNDQDEMGLGVIVRAKVKGEIGDPREIRLDLRQCNPRNSTLWATDPETQIYYRAIRMFGNVACPGILMGVPFADDEDVDAVSGRPMKNVTPEAEPKAGPAAPPEEMVEVTATDGEIFLLPLGPARMKLHELIGELAEGEDYNLLWNGNKDLIKSDQALRTAMQEKRDEFWPPKQDGQAAA